MDKYLVSPLTRQIGHGQYVASVSIRSGRGSATRDRILRFVPVFDSADEAAGYAAAQGLAWVRTPGAPAPSSSASSTQE